MNLSTKILGITTLSLGFFCLFLYIKTFNSPHCFISVAELPSPQCPQEIFAPLVLIVFSIFLFLFISDLEKALMKTPTTIPKNIVLFVMFFLLLLAAIYSATSWTFILLTLIGFTTLNESKKYQKTKNILEIKKTDIYINVTIDLLMTLYACYLASSFLVAIVGILFVIPNLNLLIKLSKFKK